MVLVLTGPVHCGKTTFLDQASARWAALGVGCSGFLSPVEIDANGETGYDLLELPGRRRSPYLRRQGPQGAERSGPFLFVPATLERARALLRRPAALLVVDEVGPLELRGGGLWPDLRNAVRRPAGTALLVVREDILAGLSAAIAPLVPVVFDIREAEDRRLLDERILAGAETHDGQD